MICPIALDESWQQAARNEGPWKSLKSVYNVLDFSGWQNESKFASNEGTPEKPRKISLLVPNRSVSKLMVAQEAGQLEIQPVPNAK